MIPRRLPLSPLEVFGLAASAKRVVIAGGPNAGKTTLANSLAHEIGRRVRNTDELLGTHEWSAASLEVSHWLDDPGPWIVEGAAVPRALRKWLRRNPDGKPADVALYLPQPVAARNKGQETMAKGVHTVWSEVLPQLEARGVIVRER